MKYKVRPSAIHDISNLGSYWSMLHPLADCDWAHLQCRLLTSCIIPPIRDTDCESWRSQSWAVYNHDPLPMVLPQLSGAWLLPFELGRLILSVFSSCISLNYYPLFLIMLSYGVVTLLALAAVSSAGPISPARRDSS